MNTSIWCAKGLRRVGAMFGVAMAILVTGCAVTTEDEGLRSTEQAIVGVDTFLYFRCNATGWGVTSQNRVKATSDPYIFEVDYAVTQSWMLGGGDQCLVTETNQQDGWGTMQNFFTTRNVAPVTVPNGSPLALGTQNFSVVYPALGNYKFRVNWRNGTFQIASATPPPTPSTWTKEEKILVLNFDPTMPSGLPLHEDRAWQDPETLADEYASDMNEASSGAVSYDIVEWKNVNAFPRKADGFTYTAAAYNACMSNPAACHSPDGVDYVKIIQDENICARVESGELDEVWLFGGPYFGYWESTMAGTGAFWVNSPPVELACGKRFILMGFNYEYGVANMLHDFGHRTESIMDRAFQSWPHPTPTPYQLFAQYDESHPGAAACGNTHNPPNAQGEYDYANPRVVSSTCALWENYPSVSGAATNVSCSTWGCVERGYQKWNFSHIPRAEGTTEGFQNDWWKYLVDHNTFVP